MLSIDQASAIVEVAAEYDKASDEFTSIVDAQRAGTLVQEYHQDQIMDITERFINARRAFENVLTSHGFVAQG